jgi:hypothetical protein
MKYGKSKAETEAENTLMCRNIVKEILDFGVNEFQKLKIIHLLSLELEDRDKMKKVSNLTKKLLNDKNNKSNKLITSN